MESFNIGTDASMATHIENIIDREYVVLEKSSRVLVCTDLGNSLINGYYKIDSSLVQPQVRGEIESNCMKIRKEGYKKEDIVRNALNIFRDKFINFTKNINRIDEIFDKIYTPLANVGKRLSSCGFCNRFMLLIEQKVPILNCVECNKDYKLIRNIENIRTNNYKCLICKFETISFKFNDKECIICP